MNNRTYILEGRLFGRWFVIEHIGRGRYKCRCECGTEKTQMATDLMKGKSTNCGCHKYDKVRSVNGHAVEKTPTYRSWQSMISRCINSKAVRFERYGGRGITVCERWRHSFLTFLADMGERPSLAHTIDRKNNDGNYEPENCRWATKREQNLNKSLRCDMTGQQLEHCFVIEKHSSNKFNRIVWKCRCSCGKEFLAVGADLRNGSTKTCGCRRNIVRKAKTPEKAAIPET